MNGFHNSIKFGKYYSLILSSGKLSVSLLFVSFDTKQVMCTAQIFGLFGGVSGITHKDSSRLKFKIKSLHFLYSLIVQIGIAIMFITSGYKQLKNRIEYSKFGKNYF